MKDGVDCVTLPTRTSHWSDLVAFSAMSRGTDDAEHEIAKQVHRYEYHPIG